MTLSGDGGRRGATGLRAYTFGPKVIRSATATSEREEFQRYLVLNGEPLYEVYPNLSANQKKYETYRKRKNPR